MSVSKNILILQYLFGIAQFILCIIMINGHNKQESCFKRDLLFQLYYAYVVIYIYMSFGVFYYTWIILTLVLEDRKSCSRAICCICFLWLFFIKVTAILSGLFDFSECFWKVSYKVRNIVKLVLEILFTLFAVALNISAVVFSSQSSADCTSFRNSAITAIIFTCVSIILTIGYFVHFTLFVPERAKSIETISEKHKRFMRYDEVGSNVCPRGSGCLSTDLEHVIRCHSKLTIPTRKCNPWYTCTGRADYMIGFHKTNYDSALAIIGSDFRPGKYGMFGGGIYFARSMNETERKAQSDASKPQAYFCAMVDMGKKRIIKAPYDKRYRDINIDNLNAVGFDSVFAEHLEGVFLQTGDEMIVFESSRVKEWILIFPDDKRITNYLIRNPAEEKEAKV